MVYAFSYEFGYFVIMNSNSCPYYNNSCIIIIKSKRMKIWKYNHFFLEGKSEIKIAAARPYMRIVVNDEETNQNAS